MSERSPRTDLGILRDETEDEQEVSYATVRCGICGWCIGCECHLDMRTDLEERETARG